MPDLTFVAKMDIEDTRFAIIEKKLSSIHQIGIVNELVKGLVDISVEKDTGAALKRDPLKLSGKKTFSRIDYTIEIRSPLCIYTPYERDTKTRSYIPGSELLEHLQNFATGADRDILDEPGLICSNAYLTYNSEQRVIMAADNQWVDIEEADIEANLPLRPKTGLLSKQSVSAAIISSGTRKRPSRVSQRT